MKKVIYLAVMVLGISYISWNVYTDYSVDYDACYNVISKAKEIIYEDQTMMEIIYESAYGTALPRKIHPDTYKSSNRTKKCVPDAGARQVSEGTYCEKMVARLKDPAKEYEVRRINSQIRNYC